MPRFSNLCLANAIEPLRAANQISHRNLYDFKLLSLDTQSVSSSSGIEINTVPLKDADKQADVFIIIASDNYAQYATSSLSAHLQAAARYAEIVAGFDGASWLLAKAGLLNGYKATIHWQELEQFEEAFLEVDVSVERYVIDRNRITAGGATTALDLMLRLIRETHGDALSLDVMRHFIYDAERASEGDQRGVISAPFVAREENLVKAISEMENNIATPLAITDIAGRAGFSARGLERAFNRNFKLSPIRYYLHLRLSHARRLVNETNLSVAEIADRCGFSSASTFTRAFSKHFKTAPRDLRRGRITSSPNVWTRS
ncbi:GlxA family transcriptional regulator [Coralliovum pocilloporae]|uniref:GlxA family transcriptional regulator n=1 Tax=Coralliovum pocilloporae TaxID=3066369 RepID=UPI003306D8EE